MSTPQNERVFWDVEVKHPWYRSGLFFRSNLKELIERAEKETGKTVVGIRYDGTYNLEFLLEMTRQPDVKEKTGEIT